jgi:hypothetical protein
MAKKEPTQLEIVVGALNAKRQSMRANCAGIGEPAVEIPIADIQTFKGEDGQLRAFIGMNKLVYLVDALLRS